MWGCDRKEDDFGPLQWLYNRMPDYEAAQRLGVDAGGFYAPLNWMNRIYRPWNKRRDPAFEGPRYGITIGNGLSMYVDMTASEWAHGSIWHADVPLDPDAKAKPETCKKEGHEGELCNHKECGAVLGAPGRLSEAAWTQGHQHWMPWSIVHPQGRGVYRHMWEGASKDAFDFAQSVGNRPWCYELLNEPACWDESPYAKKLFAQTMKRKYGSIDRLNAAWAASESGGDKRYGSFEELADAYGKGGNPTAYLVEYTKFMEGCFASLLAEGAAIVRDKVDPQALATFQPCTIRTRGIDLFTAYAPLGVVCSHTGGRGIMEAHMLRGLADGKPIVDSEMYVGSTEDSIRNSFLDQFQRGYNVSYAFKWNRTQKSSYNFLNLDNVRPEALRGIREAKLDALDVAEFFAPRDRGYPREVAVLFSSTTERLAQCAGHQSYKMFDQAIVGCDGRVQGGAIMGRDRRHARDRGRDDGPQRIRRARAGRLPRHRDRRAQGQRDRRDRHRRHEASGRVLARHAPRRFVGAPRLDRPPARGVAQALRKRLRLVRQREAARRLDRRTRHARRQGSRRGALRRNGRRPRPRRRAALRHRGHAGAPRRPGGVDRHAPHDGDEGGALPSGCAGGPRHGHAPRVEPAGAPELRGAPTPLAGRSGPGQPEGRGYERTGEDGRWS